MKSLRTAFLISAAALLPIPLLTWPYHYGLEQGRREGEKVGALCSLYDLGLVDSVTEDLAKSERVFTLKKLEVGSDGLRKTDEKSIQFKMGFPYYEPRWYPLETGNKPHQLKADVQ